VRLNKGLVSSVVILFLILSLSSCAGYNYLTLKERLNKDKAKGHYIKGLEFKKQRRHLCGPAALASVLRFWGENITQDDIADKIYLSNIRGTLTFDLENYAYNKGYFSQISHSDIHTLGERIKQNIPVIVMHQIYPIIRKYHYLVVFGYDDTDDIILAYTGKEKPQLISYFHFMRKWKSADYWMLVVCPPEKVNWELDAYYQNRLALLYERKGRLDKAKINYEKAISKDRTEPTYYFNLGNIYMKEKDFDEAISLYKRVIDLDNNFADAYNNLAFCLYKKSQDLDKAREYVDRAIELNPESRGYYLDTLGLICLKQGDIDKAISLYKQALKSFDDEDKEVLSIIYEHLKVALEARRKTQDYRK